MGRKIKVPAKKWRNALAAAQRECKAADVPFVIIGLNPDNGQAHGGYDGPASAVAGILAAAQDRMNQEMNRGSLLLDQDGKPVIAGQGGSTDEVQADVRSGGNLRRLLGSRFRRKVRPGTV